MILKFKQFITEELTNVKDWSSNSGKNTHNHVIYDDKYPDAKSLASGILLKNKLREDEFQSIIDSIGEFPKHFMDNPKLVKLMVLFNNLKFLKDSLKDKGELKCEYCNKGPLVIYDIFRNSNNIKKFLKNPYWRLSSKFNPENGATCDHKNPQSKGGAKFDYSNLAVCCYDCNQRKGNMTYDDWIKTISKS